MSLLSIIITTQNRVGILKQCLNAIFSSTDLSEVKDIIIVDDGSSDSTSQFLQQFLKEKKIAKAIRNEQTKGPATGRNKGIREAKGEYCLIMGDDIILFPTAIELFCKHIRDYGLHNASVIGNVSPYPENMTAFEYWSCNGGSQFGYYKISEKNKFDAGDEHFYTSNVVTPTAILKEHPFEETFPFARYEDRELAYRLKKKINHKIHYLAEAKSYHKHKMSFKEWLKKFEKFTWAALHFSNLYPDDSDLKTRLGITKALETESFQKDSLESAVEFINRYHKHFFDSEISFGTAWIRNIVTMSFRNLQEFFRVNHYRKHLGAPLLSDVYRKINASEAMNQIVGKLHNEV